VKDIAIRVENLSKRYHIGRARERRDTLVSAVRAPLQRLRRDPQSEDTIWALKGVSFEV
jgi:ABC-type polysaccharide/polyol phosphate transport system ATPase subunit